MSKKHDEEISVRASSGNIFADLMEDREQLRQQIRAGIDSGPGIPAEEVFDRLNAKYQAMTQA